MMIGSVYLSVIYLLILKSISFSAFFVVDLLCFSENAHLSVVNFQKKIIISESTNIGSISDIFMD